MILKSFILDNLVSLCMKIINSVVVVGLYYGFLTTFSIGPSYLFLLRARVMEEGTEKKVSATTGFITGQLMMFISIYYAPLHLALGRPHTITVIALPYLLFHFFCNNHKHFLNYGSTNQNSMRNFSIQRIFLNNLIFQLLNLFILPSSMLVRLVNIYMFRCNNQFLFLTSSFVGWLIGHILFMKWVGLVLVWIQKNNSIKSNVLIRSNKYIMSELRNFMSRIFIIFFIYFLNILFRENTPAYFDFQYKTVRNSRTRKRWNWKKNQNRCRKNFQNEGNWTRTKKIQRRISFCFSFFERKREFVQNRWKRGKRYLSIGKTSSKDYFCLYTIPSSLAIYKKCSICKCCKKCNVTILFSYMCKCCKRKNIFYVSIYFINFSCNDAKKDVSLHNRKIILCCIGYSLEFYYCTKKKQAKYCISKLGRSPRYGMFYFGCTRKKDLIMYCCDYKILTYNICSFLERTLSRTNQKKFFILNQEYNLHKKLHLDKYDSRHPSYYYYGLSRLCRENRYLWYKIIIKWNSFFFLLDQSIFWKIRIQFEFYRTLFISRTCKDGFRSYKKKKLKFLFDAILTDTNDKTIRNRKKMYWNKRKQYKRFLDGHTNYLMRYNTWKAMVKQQILRFVQEKQNVLYFILMTHRMPMLIRIPKILIILMTKMNLLYYVIHNNRILGETYSKDLDALKDVKLLIGKSFKQVHILLFFWTKWTNPLFFLLIFSNQWKYFFLIGCGKIKLKNWKCRIIQRKRKKRLRKKRKKSVLKLQKPGIAFNMLKYYEVFYLYPNRLLENIFYYPHCYYLKISFVYYYFNLPNGQRIYRIGIEKCILNAPIMAFNYPKQNFRKTGYLRVFKYRYFFLFVCNLGTDTDLSYDPLKRKRIQCKKKLKKWISSFYQFSEWKLNFPFLLFPETDVRFLIPFLKNLKKNNQNLEKEFFSNSKSIKRKNKFFSKYHKRNSTMDHPKYSQKDSISKRKNKKTIIIKSFIYIWIEKNICIQCNSKRFNKKYEYSNDLRIHHSNSILYLDRLFIDRKKKYKIYMIEQRKSYNKYKNLKKTRKKVQREIFVLRKQLMMIKDYNYKKNIWQILQKRNVRLSRKSHYFLKFFIERVYIDIFLCIINIPRINVQLFLESTKKILNKSIYNNEANEERKRSDKKNQSLIHFISTIKKSIWNIRNTNSQNFCDVSSLSQAYVFYKLSQTKIINLYKYKYKLRSVFEYHETPLFLKNEIKDSFFGVQGISHSKLKQDKSDPNSIMNQWTNWLKGHYQYDLSPNGWSRLVSKKWRNKMNEHRVAQNKDLTKYHSYEKSGLILYKKQEIDSLTNKKKKMKKQYGYDLLSYKSINYADKKDSYIYGYRSSFQANNNQAISYNSKTRKKKKNWIWRMIFLSRIIWWKILFWIWKKIWIESVLIGKFFIFVLEIKWILRVRSIPIIILRFIKKSTHPIKKKTFLIGWEWMWKYCIVLLRIGNFFSSQKFLYFIMHIPVTHGSYQSNSFFSILMSIKKVAKRKTSRKRKKLIFLDDGKKKNILNLSLRLKIKEKQNMQVYYILKHPFQRKKKMLKKIMQDPTYKRVYTKIDTRTTSKQNLITSYEGICFFNCTGAIAYMKEYCIISKYIVSCLDYKIYKKLLYPLFKEENYVYILCKLRIRRISLLQNCIKIRNCCKKEYGVSNQFVCLEKTMNNLICIKPLAFRCFIRERTKLIKDTEKKATLIRKIWINPLRNPLQEQEIKSCLKIQKKIIMICLFLKIFYPLDVVENCEFYFASILGIEIVCIEIRHFTMRIKCIIAVKFWLQVKILIEIKKNYLIYSYFFGQIIDYKIYLVCIAIGLIPIMAAVSVWYGSICIHD
uniref:Protein TIC 214 n=1 Tax=Vachellia nilotica TaxID=138033 RepID=A0A650FEL6_9FABA|nr:hypothetical chloroplast RF19 [Vachellia nilotica]QGT77187.1 hypothetical chloroplast RF19 [Vachellia nilotica]